MSSEEKTPVGIPAVEEAEPPLKKRAPTLYAIIIFKLVKGLICLVLTAIIYSEADNNMPEDYTKFLESPAVKFVMEHLRIHPENKFFTGLAEKIANLTEAKVHRAALGALLLSLFPLTEGIGLFFRVGWAGWLAIGESAFFVPIEVYTLVNRPVFSWFIFLVTVSNVIIVWYLYAFRAVLFHHHHHHPRPPSA